MPFHLRGYFLKNSLKFLLNWNLFYSWNRFYTIYSSKSTSTKLVYCIIFVCVLVSLFWSLLPYFGWSYYSFEGLNISCCVEWQDKSFNTLSYNVTILICVFVIPLFCIVFANISFIYLVGILSDCKIVSFWCINYF